MKEPRREDALPEDLLRSEKTMLLVRFLVTPWALLQILSYELPYPYGVKGKALALVAALVAGNVLLWVWLRRTPRERIWAVAVAGLLLDVVVASGFVWAYAFDQTTASWAILYIVPLEGAILFALRGALMVWGGIAVLYTLRELWGSAQYDYPLLWNSITFRMGVALFIALVAGLMARDERTQRRRAESALAELQNVDRLRSGLVSTLAHDVRTPLTVIRGAFQVLRTRTLAPERAKQLLHTADRQADRLERLATGLLDLARLEQGRLDLTAENVPLGEIVEAAVSYVDAADGVEVVVDPDLEVHADRQRLEQVFVNLLTNAQRHGGPPFVVEARARDGRVDVAFRDHGAGVAQESASDLFEPFRTTAASGSVGLGLVIVKALVEAQGGEVRYEDNEPTGAAFIVTMPRAGEPAPAASAPD